MKKKVMIIVSIAVLLVASVSANLFAEDFDGYDPSLKVTSNEVGTQPDSNPYVYFYDMAAKMNIDISGLTDDEIAMKVKQAEAELQDANTVANVPVYDAAGKLIITIESVEMAKGVLMQIGVDVQGLSGDEILLRTEEMHEHYLKVMADDRIDMGMVPWMDVILKGFYYEQQANQPPKDPSVYFYDMAAKLNIDVTGLTDDEVAMKVKQAEMELQDANAVDDIPVYDAAGEVQTIQDMAKDLGIDITGLTEEEIAIKVKEELGRR
ncbi:MAG: hypothetical protein ACYC5K_01665 [Saccharofermentanales bacterium]